jgi:anti-sigma regulatory factor (Ser/Thr protein kinase)
MVHPWTLKRFMKRFARGIEKTLRQTKSHRSAGQSAPPSALPLGVSMPSLMAPEDRGVPYGHADALVRLAACPTAPSQGRRFMKTILQLWDISAFEENAMLCTSELVTNAVIASEDTDQQAETSPREANGVVILCVIIDDGHLRIETWDASEKQATIHAASPEDEHGRGLVLVQASSDRWGSDLAFSKSQTRGPCKVTWCEWDLAATGPELP